MVAADAKQRMEIHANDDESFVSEHYKDPDLEAQNTKEEEKKAEENETYVKK